MQGRLARGGVGFGDRAALVFLSFACLASAAGSEETSASRVPKSAPTLLVSFDGFRASYLDAQDPSALPELTALWRGGVRASLRPRFISKTFPNHYSLVTGLNEQTHGIVANRFFDPDANESFAPESAKARARDAIRISESEARIEEEFARGSGSSESRGARGREETESRQESRCK